MSHPTTRVLALLELLQTHPQLGGAELARRLGVDPRTVRRYATRLIELGIPVEAVRGRYGGYRLRPGSKLPPLMFTDDEAVAVVLGLVASGRFGLVPDDIRVDSALSKLERVMPTPLRDRVSAITQTLSFASLPRQVHSPAATALLNLAEAVRTRRTVRIQYCSHRGKHTERSLNPYGLVFHSGRWYTAGHDHSRNAVRTFRLDRIEHIALTEDTFTVPAGFDAVDYVLASLTAVSYDHEVVALIETTVEQARRRVPPTVGSLEETAEGTLLRARVDDLDRMARFLAGLPWPFIIRKPEALRIAVRELASSLALLADRR